MLSSSILTSLRPLSIFATEPDARRGRDRDGGGRAPEDGGGRDFGESWGRRECRVCCGRDGLRGVAVPVRRPPDRPAAAWTATRGRPRRRPGSAGGGRQAGAGGRN